MRFKYRKVAMYGDGVTPHSGFWHFHGKVASRYRWNMNYQKTHTAPPSCPSAPFFEARDVTHNRDVVVGRNSELYRIKRREVFPETILYLLQ
jgi:hypothetical protein